MEHLAFHSDTAQPWNKLHDLHSSDFMSVVILGHVVRFTARLDFSSSHQNLHRHPELMRHFRTLKRSTTVEGQRRSADNVSNTKPMAFTY